MQIGDHDHADNAEDQLHPAVADQMWHGASPQLCCPRAIAGGFAAAQHVNGRKFRVNGVNDKTFIEERVIESIKSAALWNEVKDKLNKSAFALSGGQQQRLCIARALAISPKVLLMDEPASALDPISTSKIEELIYELKKDYTIMIVTHNMQQASRVSDKTAYFYLGEMIEYDDTIKIFTNPKELSTQNYITGRFG